MNELIFNTGDVGVINKPDTWIGKLIGRFVNNYSHTFNFIWLNGKLYIFEMKLSGLNYCLFSDSVYSKKDNWILLSPRMPLSKAEREKGQKFFEEIKLAKPEYDIMSLLKHLSLIYCRWPNKEFANDKKKICSELTAMFWGAMRPYTFWQAEAVSPKDVVMNKNFKQCQI